MAYENLDSLNDRLASLEANSGGAGAMVAAFTSELSKVQTVAQDTGKGVSDLSSGLGRGLRSAVDGLVKGGDKLSNVLSGVGKSLVDTAYSAALRPVTKQFGGALSGLFGGIFGNGAAFTQGRVTPFAQGGIFSSPTAFPMRGGTGLLGEAGPEAIMPLARGADGKLGIRGQRGRSVNVSITVNTPDVEGFRRSQSQIASEVSRALQRGQRNK